MWELIVVGGGPAGLAAACAAYERGLRKILVVERDKELGGILNQCIHNGFGLHYFKTELTGPEYAERFIRLLETTSAEVMLDTMVLEVAEGRVTVVNRDGCRTLETKAIVLAMGCRERTRGAIAIPGDRPAGVLTAGAAQRYLNMEGYMVGRRVLILGSGDIGLIMARRLTLEGAKVLACVEVMPYSGGLNRNIVQCLQDYDIPLYLSHTIVDIQGRERVERAVVAQVDAQRRPIPGTERIFECDTILLSVGLIPENELTKRAGAVIDERTGGAVVSEDMQTSLPGVFACGNVVHVHDLVDFVTAESQRAGAAAAAYVLEQAVLPEREMTLKNGEGVSYTVSQKLRLRPESGAVDVFFRVRRVCTDARIKVTAGDAVLAQYPREHMVPGEMERIRLPQKLLTAAQGTELTVSIEEAVV